MEADALSSGTDRTVRQDLRYADYLALPGDRHRDVLRRSRTAPLHARHADRSAKIRIDTLEPIDSTLERRQLRFVLAWAELHQEETARELAPRSRR
jgi:hypothetical protein